MRLLRRDWTPSDAEEWTMHDVVASLLSIACYLLVTIGVAGALLLRPWGFVALVLAAVCGVAMWRIVDPKLRAVSREFEQREAAYLQHVERTTRWETHDGR